MNEYLNPDLTQADLINREKFIHKYDEGEDPFQLREIHAIRKQVFDMAAMIYDASFADLLKCDFENLDMLATQLHNLEN